jgi:hypothetical protein
MGQKVDVLRQFIFVDFGDASLEHLICSISIFVREQREFRANPNNALKKLTAHSGTRGRYTCRECDQAISVCAVEDANKQPGRGR